MKYRNRIPEPGTTISGFADNKKKPQKPRFFLPVTANSHIFLFGLMYNLTIRRIVKTLTLDQEI